MIYKNFKGKNLSALGLGCMRLPIGKDEKIDMDKSAEMVAYALENGINYFDTAWGYHNGESEIAMGKILNKYPRSSFFLASKFPGFDLDNMSKVEEIFEKQLKKCQVDYFDFYLFHNVCENNVDMYIDPQYHIFEYLSKQKELGRIKHLGFSAHGNMDTLKKFLEAYGDSMEFCQLQINWIDWEFQNAKEKVELMTSYGIPVWVMEPVRGGSLANIMPPFNKKLKDAKPDWSAVEWAFRFIQSIPEVAVTLSGMSNFEQLKENIEIFKTNDPLNHKENELLFKIAKAMTSKDTLPCTACRYCTPKCPMELNIPWFMELYNEHIYTGGGFIAPMALESLPQDKLPSSCIGCRACEEVCPQNIKISEMMSDFTEKLK